MSISTDDRTAELDTAQIVAAVADALLRTGALPASSALLSGSPAANGGNPGWRLPLMHLLARPAHQRARTAEPHRAGFAGAPPPPHAPPANRSITPHEGPGSLPLY